MLGWQYRQRQSDMERSKAMNWDIVEGNWLQFKGKVQEEWGNLTDDRLDVIAGKRDRLSGQLQESYGISKDIAEEKIRDFESRNMPPK